MIKKSDTMTVSLEKKFIRLKKLAQLQGFVTEQQITEISESTKEVIQLRNLLEKEKLTINTLVGDKKAILERRHRYAITPRRGEVHYTDPTWVYLNSVGRVPLLTRDEEAQYARQMEFAQNKLFDMAFCSQEALESLYRIGDEFKRNVINCIDVLQVNEEEQTDPEKYEELRKNFLKTIALIKRKNTIKSV